MPDDRRVVVTGLGVVSSLGIGWQEWWTNIMAGKSGISRISAFDTTDHDIKYAGEIKNFKFRTHVGKDNFSSFGRASQLAVESCRLALEDSKISLSTVKKLNMAFSIGTTMGESQVIEQIVKHGINKDDSEIKRLRALSYPANSIAINVAHAFGLKNKNIIFANACAAGNYALGYGFDLIRSGKVDYVLTGGVDALSRIAFTGFGRMFAMAPEKCQPFDKNRKGMMLGEGGAILILESLQSALKRKATVYAEICGYGLSCDANHMTHPDVSGVKRAILKSLKLAGVNLEDVSYISAHGTGTKENDRAECLAFREVFGKELDRIPVSSIKAMLGHTMGAASAFESIACCLSSVHNEIPPTINFEENDEDCQIDCVPNKGRKHRCKAILNNSQAFGGNNAALLVKSLDSG
ncbi:MAG: beta-ketoacyl-[acyl-carrier-protein] synthase family protein [Candidatus Omnitrophica bacterium]|nr:beta-ketoacyl-[acyl-carrier-protein] synthase family protein [Candidatus Omnitrophota bacterium]